jgi:hypothetical protein
MIAAGVVPSIVLFAARFALLESQRWLIAQACRDEAHRPLARVRPGGADLDGEPKGIAETIRQRDPSSPGGRSFVKRA